jgi:aspartyl-tRNA synthetase
MRTHFCGLVDEALIGQTVTLCGWADVARNLGGLCFIDLRDHEGIVQVLAEPDAPDVFGRREGGLRGRAAHHRHGARCATR